ncbi:type II toxin-antitoxin system Phd/YefM family antitoxin [Caenispirillum salinarum]|uniref:type II toxin-antitoxin system Phd/YefM family antitoxin n=1 Tax=Caenispirillum salinarum TaxID=859058 RepID=UPI0038507B16
MTVHEAEENFMSLLDQSKAGETVEIFQDGMPVARLSPSGRTAEQRAKAQKEALAEMRRGFNLGGETFDRESLYDRFDR